MTSSEATTRDVSSSAGTQPAAAGSGHPAPRGHRLVRWLPVLTVLVVTGATLVALDTPVVDVLRYLGYLGWAVLVPGTLVYRSLRRTPHSLVDDLAFGAATGLPLEVVVSSLASATGTRGLLWLWPLLVAVPFAAVPRLRRHWRATDYPHRATLGWSWAVAAVVLALFGYVAVAFLAPNQPVPTTGTRAYFIDQLYLLSLVAEAKHHFPLQSPQLAGESLLYHWFSFTHLGTASTISGVDAPVVLFRLGLPAMCSGAILLVAVAGWRIFARPWVGFTAAALTFAVGEVIAGSYAITPLGGITAYMIWASQSMVYGLLYLIPLVVVIVDRLRGGLPDAPLGPAAWVLLVVFASGSTGAKSTSVPVLLCGIALVALVELVRRRPTRTTWLIAGILLLAQVFGVAVLYRFETLGLRISPLELFDWFLVPVRNRPLWKDIAVEGFALGAYAIFMLSRLAGIPVLAWLRRRAWGPVEWFLLGGFTGGALATLLIGHPAWSQNYFIRSGWVCGALLSALGLAALVERYRLAPRTVAVVTVGSAAVAVGVALIMWRTGGAAGGRSYRAFLPIYRPALLIAVAGVLACAALLVAGRRHPRLRGVAALTALLLALAAGVPGLAWDAYLNPNARDYYHQQVSPDQAAAARWVRAHSDPDDLLATNARCLVAAPGTCRGLSFWLSAYAERRVLLEGWGYTARGNADSTATGLPVGATPFWDADLSAANDAAIYAPTPENLAALGRRGVRWIVVDRRIGRESARLSMLAPLRFEQGPIAVYQLS